MTPNVLAVSSTGGHLDELLAIAPRFASEGQRLVWVTAATAQSESLLRGQDVEWVRQVGSRQVGRVLSSLPQATRVIRRHRPDKVVSTGAALSVSYLLVARLHGIETHYVESATRLEGPSLTGRIAQSLPGVSLHRQADSWHHCSGAWRSVRSVFDAFEWSWRPAPDSLKILVILGTERFPFPRAVSAVIDAAPQDADLVWQLGHTPRSEKLPGEVRDWFPFDELQRAVLSADVVITHCGVGSVLMALRNQKCPVVIPRLSGRHEHIDDHQVELAHVLKESGLAIVADSHEKDLSAHIAQAATRVVRERQDDRAVSTTEGD